MWNEFKSNNLRERLCKSIFPLPSTDKRAPRLDLFGWSLIGLVRCPRLIIDLHYVTVARFLNCNRAHLAFQLDRFMSVWRWHRGLQLHGVPM